MFPIDQSRRMMLILNSIQYGTFFDPFTPTGPELANRVGRRMFRGGRFGFIGEGLGASVGVSTRWEDIDEVVTRKRIIIFETPRPENLYMRIKATGHSERIQVLYNNADTNRCSHDISGTNTNNTDMAESPQVPNRGCWALLRTQHMHGRSCSHAVMGQAVMILHWQKQILYSFPAC